MADRKSARRLGARTPTSNIARGNRVYRPQEYSCVPSYPAENERQIQTDRGAEVVSSPLNKVQQGNRFEIISGYPAKGGRQPPEHGPCEERYHGPRAREPRESAPASPHADERKHHDGGDGEIDPSDKAHQPERGFHWHGDAQRGFERAGYQLRKRDLSGYGPAAVSGEVEYVRSRRQRVEDEQSAVPEQVSIHRHAWVTGIAALYILSGTASALSTESQCRGRDLNPQDLAITAF